MQGSSRPDRELSDAAALYGHLLGEGSVHAFLAEHRPRLSTSTSRSPSNELLLRGIEGGRGEGAVDDVVGDVDQPEVVVAGVVAQRGEGLFHVEAGAFGDHALGLLDDDAAVEGVVELLVDDLGLERGAVLEDGDGGDVGEGLGGVDVGLSHLARLGVEQVEGADDGAPQPHGQGVHRVEAGGERLGARTGASGRRPRPGPGSTTGWPVR